MKYAMSKEESGRPALIQEALDRKYTAGTTA
jgi:hypothetical protein